MTPPVTQTTFGERLRAARLEAKMTNWQLASALGVPERSVYRWQSGANEPSWRTVVKLVDVLDKPLSFFIDEEVA